MIVVYLKIIYAVNIVLTINLRCNLFIQTVKLNRNFVIRKKLFDYFNTIGFFFFFSFKLINILLNKWISKRHLFQALILLVMCD